MKLYTTMNNKKHTARKILYSNTTSTEYILRDGTKIIIKSARIHVPEIIHQLCEAPQSKLCVLQKLTVFKQKRTNNPIYIVYNVDGSLAIGYLTRVMDFRNTFQITLKKKVIYTDKHLYRSAVK